MRPGPLWLITALVVTLIVANILFKCVTTQSNADDSARIELDLENVTWDKPGQSSINWV